MLDCGACVLRPWREEDVPSLARHADSYEVRRCLRDRFPPPYTRANAEWWVSFARSQDPKTSCAPIDEANDPSVVRVSDG